MINLLKKTHDEMGIGLTIDDDFVFTKPELKNYDKFAEKNKFFA
jgi:hypothetical protein